MTEHDGELDATVDELAAAGLVETYTDDDGKPAYRLTREGAAVGRQLAMTEGGDERLAIINELLDAGPSSV